MIVRDDLEAFGFDTIHEFYEYIVESRTNGQHSQAKGLFNCLSDDMQGQQVEFFRWLNEVELEPYNWQEYLKCFIAF